MDVANVSVYLDCTHSFFPSLLRQEKVKDQSWTNHSMSFLPQQWEWFKDLHIAPVGNEGPIWHLYIVAGKMNLVTCWLLVRLQFCILGENKASSWETELRNRRQPLAASSISHTGYDVKSLKLTNLLYCFEINLRCGFITYSWKKLDFYNKTWPCHG